MQFGFVSIAWLLCLGCSRNPSKDCMTSIWVESLATRVRNSEFIPNLQSRSNRSEFHTMEELLLDQKDFDGRQVQQNSTGALRRPTWMSIMWTTLVTITLTSLAWIRCTPHTDASEAMFDDYRDIPASANLIWHPCFNDFLCAKLQVPMNHDATVFPHCENSLFVDIALIMVSP
jgi:hypothetical protein